jgi:hypothetical protein
MDRAVFFSLISTCCILRRAIALSCPGIFSFQTFPLDEIPLFFPERSLTKGQWEKKSGGSLFFCREPGLIQAVFQKDVVVAAQIRTA